MIKLLSHLSYVAVTSPDVEASADFYVKHVGLTIVDRIDGAVYLRCWGDYYRYSVVILPGDGPALSTMAWRTSSPSHFTGGRSSSPGDVDACQVARR